MYHLSLYLYMYLTIKGCPLHFSIYFPLPSLPPSQYLTIQRCPCTAQYVSQSTIFLCLSPSRVVPLIFLPNLFFYHLFVYLSIRGVPFTSLCISSPLACPVIFLSLYQLFISVLAKQVARAFLNLSLWRQFISVFRPPGMSPLFLIFYLSFCQLSVSLWEVYHHLEVSLLFLYLYQSVYLKPWVSPLFLSISLPISYLSIYSCISPSRGVPRTGCPLRPQFWSCWRTPLRIL
jgi:hypothetical protein